MAIYSQAHAGGGGWWRKICFLIRAKNFDRQQIFAAARITKQQKINECNEPYVHTQHLIRSKLGAADCTPFILSSFLNPPARRNQKK